MPQETYSIRNNETGEYFTGFAPDGTPLWDLDTSKAWADTREKAELQASLLKTAKYRDKLLEH